MPPLSLWGWVFNWRLLVRPLASGLLSESSESTGEPSDGAPPRFPLSPDWEAPTAEATPGWATLPSMANMEEAVGKDAPEGGGDLAGGSVLLGCVPGVSSFFGHLV